MKYLITKEDSFFGVSIARIEEDGTIVWLGLREGDLNYQKWLAEGNTPEEWNNGL